MFIVPIWNVHYDAGLNVAVNTAAFQFVIDFFTGAVIHQSASGPFATIDPSSLPFHWGATVVDTTIGIASAAYLIALGLSSEAGGIAAAPAATAVMLGAALISGLALWIAYPDKASKLNMLAGMLAEFGLGAVRYFIRVGGVIVPVPLPCCSQFFMFGVGTLWTPFWIIAQFATPWARAILLTGLLTWFMAVLMVFLYLGFAL